MKVAYLVIRYPTLSQTFIDREMRGVAAQSGMRVEVHPLFSSKDGGHGDHGPLTLRRTRVARLLAAAVAELVRVLLRRPGLAWRGLTVAARHWPQTWENAFHTLWGTVFALGKANTFRREAPVHFHGAWATAPATAAAVLGALCGRPWSFGAHAYDVYRDGGDALLAPKLAGAAFVHTTTAANVRYLTENFPGRTAPIVLARRGLAAMPEFPRRTAAADGTFRLLAVGRLIGKKGYHHLLDGCAELARRGVTFHVELVGDGPLESALRAQATAAGLDDGRVTFRGALPASSVWELYRAADVFVFTGVVDAAGDRDGLPNVVPEAMAHGLPVIAGREPGVGEAVRDGETGLVVDVTDAAALADAVERLRADAGLRERLGSAGRAWVAANFLAEKNTATLAAAFGRHEKP